MISNVKLLTVLSPLLLCLGNPSSTIAKIDAVVPTRKTALVRHIQPQNLH
jgi:hypothetical protein